MRYKHPDNKHKEWIDWRDQDRRLEGFLIWLKWRLRWSDLDHYGVNNTYRDHVNMTESQKFWYSLIFGMTYQSEMAWVIFSNWPNLEKINLKELQEWNVETFPRQRYARDTKYNKGRITDQVSSIQKVFDGAPEVYLKAQMIGDGEHENFEQVFRAVQKLHKFGRMTSWITCQTLFETCNLPILPKTMMATDPSNWSVRSGLMYLYGKDDKIESKGASFDSADIRWIEDKELELFDLAIERIDEQDRKIFSNYLLESHLCQYKKLMLGGDYPGHSSGDHVSRAIWLAERWPEVEFGPFFEKATQLHHPLVRGLPKSKVLDKLCAKTGQLINMHEDFDFLPDIYLELGASVGDDDDYLQKRIDIYLSDVSTQRNLETFFS